MSRLEQLDYEKLTKAQRQVYDEIVSGPRGRVRGPLAVWLNRPDLADRAQKLGQYVRYDTMLPPRLSELAILLTARIWSAEFEWWAHRPLAEKAGVASAVIESIRTGSRPTYGAEDEAIVHDFAASLHLNRQVDDKTYQRAVNLLGQEAVVDLVGILGYYTLVSMTINAFQVTPPEGSQPELSACPLEASFFSTEGRE
jgi:4-carboxymuconolactone decarboxylase